MAKYRVKIWNTTVECGYAVIEADDAAKAEATARAVMWDGDAAKKIEFWVEDGDFEFDIEPEADEVGVDFHQEDFDWEASQ